MLNETHLASPRYKISDFFSSLLNVEQRHETSIVIGNTKERWRELHEQASVEQDPDKQLKLIREINQLLEEKGTP